MTSFVELTFCHLNNVFKMTKIRNLVIQLFCQNGGILKIVILASYNILQRDKVRKIVILQR